MKNRNMFYFKACSKCQGDMYLERDAYGDFRKCLQCGQIEEFERPVTVVRQVKSYKLAA